MENYTRKLAAIMFTDIVGYSQIMSENESHGLELLKKHDEILVKIIEEYEGKIMKKMGDAIFADFASSVNAVKCAIAIQTALKNYNDDKDIKDKIIIRIGLHIGDVIVQGEDLFGEGINVAARLEPLASPGGICMSQAIYESVKSLIKLNTVKIGEVELKNILEKHIIYKVPSFYAEDYVIADKVKNDKTTKSFIGFKIKSIKKLPPPSRTPLLVLLASVFMLLLVTIITAFSIFYLSPQYSNYYIHKSDFIDPVSVIRNLRNENDIAHTYLYKHLKTQTNKHISNFNLSDVEFDSTKSLDSLIILIQNDFNRLIFCKKLILKEQALEHIRFTSELKELVKNNPQGKELLLANRLIINQLFPNSLEIVNSDQSVIDSYINKWDLVINKFMKRNIGEFIHILLLGGLGCFIWVYCYSLKTILISFDDVRNVDDILDYFVQQIGFKSPVKEGNIIIFKAKLRTFFIWNAWKIRVIIDGNTVIITGTMIMINKLLKRIKAYSKA